MAMVRVAQIMGYMNGGGVESVVMNYYRHINREHVQFDFIVCEGSTQVPKREIESLGGRVFMVPPYSDLIGYQKVLIFLFREQCWNIVHSHMNTLSVFPLRAANRAGVPIRIAHSHSSGGGGEGEAARDLLKTLLKQFSRVYPTHLLACSHVAGDWLFGSNSGYEVLPNAIDIASFAPDESLRIQARRNLGIADETFVVGHIGRMAPPKNHRMLLSIFRELLEFNPDSILLLIGDGPLMEQVRQTARDMGVSDRVCFYGQKGDTAMFYRAFDVFCLPSLYEGLPVVGIECQASETPILASNAVTPETKVTSLMDFESLDSSPRAWAKHLFSMRGRALGQNDRDSLSTFDVNCTAYDLECIYENCLVGVQ